MSESDARVVYEATAVALRGRGTAKTVEVIGHSYTVLAEASAYGRQRAEVLPLDRLRAMYPAAEGWRHHVTLVAVPRENLHAALEWLDTGARPERLARAEPVGA